MKIKLSRHAKRRAKLYKIPESLIYSALENMEFSEGRQEIIQEVASYKFPLKIVVNIENDIITAVTCYPMKRGRKK